MTANYFAELGVPAGIGRTFLPDEDRSAGANAVVVLSHYFWQRKYRGDPNVIGRIIKQNGMPYTVVGVAPREFNGTAVFPVEVSFWAPFSMIEQLIPHSGRLARRMARSSRPRTSGAAQERRRSRPCASRSRRTGSRVSRFASR